ncbi:MAG: NHL repeat-containing protein [Saprospiraceae bacterium]|nr:NHL repeat-containing protein [Saprospiraceae bacterium]
MKKNQRFFKMLVLLVFFLPGLSAQTTFEVLVSSRGTNAVKKYDLDGNYLGDFVASGDGGLNGTEDILFHPDGSVLVSGFNNTKIKRYDGETGAFIGDFSSGYNLDTPSKMSIGPDDLVYVTQWGTSQNKVVRFDLDGNFVDEFTSTGVSNGLSHLWDADGNFYISAYGNGGNGTIQKFDPDGNSLGTFINSTYLQGPTGIWVDSAGDMLVEDWTVGKVLRYNSQGIYQGVFLTGMTNPEGIAFTPDGHMLIGDWGQDAVHEFDSDGNHIGIFTSGNALTDPNSVKIREVAISSAVMETKQETGFKVSPTLSAGTFQIEVNLKQKSQIQLYVSALNGQLIHVIQPEINVSGLTQYEWIPAPELPSGEYFIWLIHDKIPSCQKIILTR